MFRTTTHCNRYEFTSFRLDNPITIPRAGEHQKKTGYSFTIHDRTAYYDWYKAYLKIKFKIVKMDNTNFGPNDRIAPISDVASLIKNLRISKNYNTLYDSTDTYRVTHIKNLLKKSVATNEFYYPDENRSTIIDSTHLDYNKGFRDRQQSITEGKEENAIIPLNKFSFFEGLSNNILPPAQVKIVIDLTDDNTALYRDAGVDDGKVIVTELVLWVPRLNLKEESISMVKEKYLSPNATWTCLREIVEESTERIQVDSSWRIKSSVKKPRHVFVYLQKANKNNTQTENVHILDTFNIGGVKLRSARLEVGSGIFYPETEYSSNDMERIYRDVIEYTHKQDTDLFLTSDNFENIYGMLYFNLTYNSGNLGTYPVQLCLRYNLDKVPDDDYKIFAIVLYEQKRYGWNWN